MFECLGAKVDREPRMHFLEQIVVVFLFVYETSVMVDIDACVWLGLMFGSMQST